VTNVGEQIDVLAEVAGAEEEVAHTICARPLDEADAAVDALEHRAGHGGSRHRPAGADQRAEQLVAAGDRAVKRRQPIRCQYLGEALGAIP
jgi:hypothetical protein